MIRYTTPTLKLHIKKKDGTPYDMSLVKDGYIAFSQLDKTIIEKPFSDCQIEGDAIAVFLTQEETGLCATGGVDIQAIIQNTDGTVVATNIRYTIVKKILSEKVFE